MSLSVSSKGNLTKHKRALHEGVKYPSELCQCQATTKRSLTWHIGAVYEGVKYHYEATTKGNLAQHKRVVHQG